MNNKKKNYSILIINKIVNNTLKRIDIRHKNT